MKVNVTFSGTGHSKVPFELEQKQLIDFLCALKHYTGAGWAADGGGAEG